MRVVLGLLLLPVLAGCGEGSLWDGQYAGSLLLEQRHLNGGVAPDERVPFEWTVAETSDGLEILTNGACPTLRGPVSAQEVMTVTTAECVPEAVSGDIARVFDLRAGKVTRGADVVLVDGLRFLTHTERAGQPLDWVEFTYSGRLVKKP